MSLDSDMQFFALLARQSSFSGAALQLGISPSAVSRRLARIEDRLGARLLNRTTRRTSLTSEGEAYLKASLAILAQIEMVEQSLARSRERPHGLLRINATFQFGREHVAPAIGDFVGRHPEVEAQLVVSDAPLNLVEEGFDLGIRFGLPPSSRLVARLLLRNRRLLVASPAYLARHGTPRRLSDLAAHNCIVLRQEHDAYDVWRFDGGDSAKVSGTLSTNDGELAVNWVLQGLGIMLRSEWDVNRHIAAGRLRVVLPRHHSEAHIYAVYPERLNLSAKVRHFVDFLSQRLERLRVSRELGGTGEQGA
ncbi:LysR family transcriptional regulator [Geminicoccus roseus]|uniref:LysR family transcriptional regulator n=1 Tax=Geminicoccus roseus TaxID=404900 RepID=UPI000424C5CA|nr:LysR family transcriptional regulator [Geminicoccus roseus]